MKNPIIEKAIEKFDEIFNAIFVVSNTHQAFTEKQWNEEIAPLFRRLRKLISEPFNEL